MGDRILGLSLEGADPELTDGNLPPPQVLSWKALPTLHWIHWNKQSPLALGHCWTPLQGILPAPRGLQHYRRLHPCAPEGRPQTQLVRPPAQAASWARGCPQRSHGGGGVLGKT